MKKKLQISRNDLLDGHRRYCIVCKNQIATVHGRFVEHGTVTTKGMVKACPNSGKPPLKVAKV